MHETPLIETLRARVLGALTPPTRAALKGVLEVPDDGTGLHGPVDEHLQFLEKAATSNEFLDLALARRLAGHCHALLDGLAPEGASDARARLARAAVRYFVLGEGGMGRVHRVRRLQGSAPADLGLCAWPSHSRVRGKSTARPPA
jgi:hypothetical protein